MRDDDKEGEGGEKRKRKRKRKRGREREEDGEVRGGRRGRRGKEQYEKYEEEREEEKYECTRLGEMGMILSKSSARSFAFSWSATSNLLSRQHARTTHDSDIPLSLYLTLSLPLAPSFSVTPSSPLSLSPSLILPSLYLSLSRSLDE